MNLCRCDQGHFYDKEKYASCPHCAGGSASDENRTEAFADEFTTPLSQEAPAAPPIAPMAPIAPAAPVSPAVPPIAPLPPVNSLPIAGISANQVTVAMGNIAVDTPTVPLEDMFSDPMSDSDEDSDHTVGFFDDVFSEASAASVKPSAKAAVPKAAKNKVSTPCVGWLIALGGEHIGTDFRLKVGKNFIGRSQQMDVSLTEDKSVSRESHAIVVYEPKSHLYLVQPGESSSLVYRNNDVVLTPIKLEAYDMITVGDINLLFIPLCGERFNWGDLLEEMKKKNKQEK